MMKNVKKFLKTHHSEIKKCVETNIAIVKIAPVILVHAQQKINANVNNYGEKLCYRYYYLMLFLVLL